MGTKETILDWAQHWEKTAANRTYMTQPLGGGADTVKTWTFAEAMDEVRRMAAHLRSLDLPPGSNIAICSKNCAHWILADLAIWAAGHVSVPIYPILTADTVQYILEHSEAKLLFVGKLDPVWNEMKQGVPAGLPQIAFPLAPPSDLERWDDIIARTAPLEGELRRGADELATIIYTSGSTGRPKGVVHNFKSGLAAIEAMNRMLGINADERLLSYLPLAHIFERVAIEHSSLYTGCQVFFAESLDTFVKDIQRARPTLFISVPRLWLKFQLGVYKKLPPKKLDLFLKLPILSGIVKKKVLTQLGLNEVRLAISGSAPIPAELIEWYRRLGLELLEGYGMTENFALSHIARPGQVRAGYVGSPQPTVESKLSPEGEILVKGAGDMVGYYKLPEATAESFTEDGFLKTGDRGEIDELQRLKITGRVKELFKTAKGKYVAPAPIENLLVNHPRIEMCCVTGSGRPSAYALVQLSEDARAAAKNGSKSAIEAELKEHLQAVNAALPEHEKLGFLAIIDDPWLPENGLLTPTMKLVRPKIEDAYAGSADAWVDQKKPIVWA